MTSTGSASPFWPALRREADDDLLEDEPGDDADIADDAGPAARCAAPDEATLAGWVERIVDRDERALEALYDATSRRVFAFVQRITGNVALAEEVVEDTFWQVWRQAPRFDVVRGKAITWLLSMARSRAIDALRRDKRFAHDEMPDDDAVEGADDVLPADLVDAARQGKAVHLALEQLDSKSRQLVSLAFLRGLTHEEIAAQTALPLGTVKSLIRRSLQQLRCVLEAGHAKP